MTTETTSVETPTGVGGPSAGVRARVVVLALVAAILAPMFAATPSASAATCRRYSRSYNVSVNKYIFAPGWGWTAWAVRPNVHVTDNCTSGQISVFPNLYDAAVRAKGGKLLTTSVSYKTNKMSSFWPLGRTQTWPSEAFSLPKGCFADGEKVTHIRITTVVYGRAAGGGWVGLASSTNTFAI